MNMVNGTQHLPIPTPSQTHRWVHKPPVAWNETGVVYGTCFPLQIGERQAACLVGRKFSGAGYTDFEDGCDLIVFDDLDDFGEKDPIPLVRNHEEDFTKPDGSTVRIVLVKYPPRVGFVPKGARRPDGSPHPHAGTGYGLNHVIAFEKLDPSIPKDPVRWAEFKERHKQEKLRGEWPFLEYVELHQYAFDGERFQVTSKERREFDDLLPPWRLGRHDGFTIAIPDGDDLLHTMYDGRSGNAGVARWRRVDGQWRPIDFNLVTDDACNENQGKRLVRMLEPSVARSSDGSLWFTVRYAGTTKKNNQFRLWRSTDVGQNWTEVATLDDQHEPSPTTINRSRDGSLYLLANKPRDESSQNPRGKLRVSRIDERTPSVTEPALLLDAEQFPNPDPRSPNEWWADHPVGTPVRLKDGLWRDLVGFRVTNSLEVHGAPELSMEASGAYLKELNFDGADNPPWSFAD